MDFEICIFNSVIFNLFLLWFSNNTLKLEQNTATLAKLLVMDEIQTETLSQNLV